MSAPEKPFWVIEYLILGNSSDPPSYLKPGRAYFVSTPDLSEALRFADRASAQAMIAYAGEGRAGVMGALKATRRTGLDKVLSKR